MHLRVRGKAVGSVKVQSRRIEAKTTHSSSVGLVYPVFTCDGFRYVLPAS